MDEGRKSQGFDAVLEVWSRRKWLAIPLFAGVFTAVVCVVAFLPNMYRSTATVVVERQQVPEAFVQATVTSAVESRLQTISQEILSRSRLISLIDRFGLYVDLKKRVPIEEVVERMRKDIKLELKGAEQKGSNRVTVAFALSYQGNEPEKVAHVANTLASSYIEENLKVREQQAIGTAEFLQVQLAETKKNLDEQEQRVSRFKKRHIGELPQQQEANLAILERLHTQLRLNSDNQIRAGERRSELAKQLEETDSFGTPGGPDATAVWIAKLKQELAALQMRFSDKYPDVIQKQAEIASLEEQMSRATRDEGRKKEEALPPSPHALKLKQAISEVDAAIKVLKAEEHGLRQSIGAYQRRVENTPQWEQEFQVLSRDYESTKELYSSLLKRYEEAKLSESMEQRQKGEHFRVVDPAMASEQPTAPNRVRLTLMGLLLALGLAAGAVVLAEQIDTSFHTVDDLRAFSQVPVLVSIPRIVTEGDVIRKRSRVRLAAASAIVGLVLIVGLSYFVAKGNEQMVSLLSKGQM